MILTPDNEFSAVLDACVLAPMLLCDTLLRCAEEPALFRLVWSSETLLELKDLLGREFSDPSIAETRLRKLNDAFPEACVSVPSSLLGACHGITGERDKHVLAVAIYEKAHVIVTWRKGVFPTESVAPYCIDVQHPDDFLCHQYHLNRERVLDVLDLQASLMRVQRVEVVNHLASRLPEFTKLARTARR